VDLLVEELASIEERPAEAVLIDLAVAAITHAGQADDRPISRRLNDQALAQHQRLEERARELRRQSSRLEGALAEALGARLTAWREMHEDTGRPHTPDGWGFAEYEMPLRADWWQTRRPSSSSTSLDARRTASRRP